MRVLTRFNKENILIHRYVHTVLKVRECVYKIKTNEKKVLGELEHIPKGPLPQGELKAMYWMQRMHGLDKKAKGNKTVKEVLEKCIFV